VVDVAADDSDTWQEFDAAGEAHAAGQVDEYQDGASDTTDMQSDLVVYAASTAAPEAQAHQQASQYLGHLDTDSSFEDDDTPIGPAVPPQKNFGIVDGF
jgi:hypothetical protein